MDKRQKAIEELKKMIRQQRARVDPALLEKGAQAAGAPQKTSLKQALKPAEKTVPYDKDAAKAAIKLFLENHADPEGFEKKLFAFLKKSQH